ncbi:MAG: hypothetical protein EA425_07725 [Puniceicoccaceae bacterium]|nr:MAG: hypothetical protein EA425_07725 [Puniceicoccaceae bacterium]
MRPERRSGRLGRFSPDALKRREPTMPNAVARPLHVLHLHGRNPYQDFRDGPGRPDDSGHPPVNFHAYAACTGGAWHRDPGTLPPRADVLLLLTRHLRREARCLARLRKAGHRVLVAFKETGYHQAPALLGSAGPLLRIREIVTQADGCLTPVLWLAPVLHGLRPGHPPHSCTFIPTPYPIDHDGWDFSVPEERREGIFLGTREPQVPSRLHLPALLALAARARTLDTRITLISPRPRRERSLYRALGEAAELLDIVPGPLPYPEYLRLMTRYRLVFQWDRSGVPGQVAGDALLCRMACVGGDSAVGTVAFGGPQDPSDALDRACHLYLDTGSRETAVKEALARARLRLGFGPVAERIARFLDGLNE